MNEYIFYDFVFDAREIHDLYQDCITQNWKLVCNRYYKDLDNYPNPIKIIKSYFNHLPVYESECLRICVTKEFSYYNDVKLAKYEVNNDFDWHTDYYSDNDKHPNLKRQLSSITYINDDYEGGETEFSCGVTIKPEKGKTVIFPSTWLFPHRGKAVTKGTKYIYVNHIWA